MKSIDTEKLKDIQDSITKSMMDIFDSVIKKKKSEYEKKGTIYSSTDVEKLISKCGNTNAVISGSAGLIPGPWGMLAVIPEISLIIKNQIDLIYDIGKAYGKSDTQLSKELLVGIFASASGSAGIGLITIHAGKILVKRASLRVMQKVVAMLGGKVTQRLLKSMVAKWLPGVGAAAMAAWAKISTNMVGKKATEILSKEIITSEEEMIDVSDSVTELLVNSNPEPVIKNKIILFSNLMKIDGVIDKKEVSYIVKIIENMDITEKTTSELLKIVHSPDKGEVDFELLKEYDEAISILIDMIALSKVDGNLHDFEQAYIIEVGGIFGFSEDEIVEMINI
jgi:uncharacterized tellurite resistance protein B-like protein